MKEMFFLRTDMFSFKVIMTKIKFRKFNVDLIITLPTNVCLVKATVVPVVMYGCKSWTIKKAEC